MTFSGAIHTFVVVLILLAFVHYGLLIYRMLKARKVTRLSRWLRKWRARRAFSGYPLYDPPHRSREKDLTEAEAEENFDYFMRVRLERIEFLRGWLVRHFKVDLTFDEDGIDSLSKWLNKYGAFLVLHREAAAMQLATYLPAWVGEYVGLNVIYDIGIFIGEYLIIKRPKLHWKMYLGHEVEPASYTSIGYRRPLVTGFPFGWVKDTVTMTFWIVVQLHQHGHMGSPSPRSAQRDALVEFVGSTLYYATLQETDGPVVIGDWRANNG